METQTAKELEQNFLSAIITSSIFLVAGISLIRFTDMGPIFSVVSLLAAFFLFLAIVTDFFVKRKEVNGQDGQSTRTLIDILAYILIPVLLMIAWMIIVVWKQIDWKIIKSHISC